MRHDSYLEVNLKLFAENCEKLKKISSTQSIFMVKANAYGHGLVPMTKFAYENKFFDDFGCATLGEALELKKEIKNLKAKVYVFSETDCDSKEQFQHYDKGLIPVAHNIKDLELICKNDSIPLVLKFNTGMNRLGLLPEELESVISVLKKSGRKSLFHVMSHYSLSYHLIERQTKTQKQYAEFKRIISELKSSGFEIEHTSMANSGAIEQKYSVEESYLRPGLMLYGPSSLYPQKSIWDGHIVSQLKTKIIHWEKVQKGMTLGYGDYVCGHDGFRAVLPLGYGDGFLTYYKDAKLIHEGIEAKFIGRVNMDLTQIFFEQNAQGKVKVGDEITLWDNTQERCQQLAEQVGTIPYQLFCGLTERLPRKYIQ